MELSENKTYYLRENKMGREHYGCRFRYVFGKDSICFYFDVNDEDIISPYQEDNDDIWHGDTVEVFISPDGDLKRYKEIEVSPLGSGTHVVMLAESTVKDNARLFDDISEVPRKAFTMGIKQIMQAKKILILASGANKAEAVYKMVKGKVTEKVPASVLQIHPDCTLIADESAAGKLEL